MPLKSDAPPSPSNGSSSSSLHHLDPRNGQDWVPMTSDPLAASVKTRRGFQARTWLFRVLFALLLTVCAFWASGLGRNPLPTFTYRLIPPHTPLFLFAEREPGNLQRIVNGIAPRDPPITRKPGILAVPVGAKSKHNMKPVLSLFEREGFEIVLFHYDDADWSEVPNYTKWTSVRTSRQTKLWYAKRFLTPRVVENYDYIFLWDDDIELPERWSPTAFVQLLKDYNIHMAQPALLSGLRENPQHNVVRIHNETQPPTPESWDASGISALDLATHIEPDHIGRFTNFVEVMFPVFSRAAWSCAWRITPLDGVSYWGTDNAWYPVCAAHGMCRFAVIDSMPVNHLDKRRLQQNPDKNLEELAHYREMVLHTCHEGPEMTIVDSEDPNDPFAMRARPWQATPQSRTVCDYYVNHPFGRAFYNVRNISREHDMGTTTCPESRYWSQPNMPWWGPETEPPPHQVGWWIGREKELAKVHKIKQREIEERKRLGGKNKGSW